MAKKVSRTLTVLVPVGALMIGGVVFAASSGSLFGFRSIRKVKQGPRSKPKCTGS